MSIKSIKIKNLLSFDELIIDKFEDVNCIVGKNNAGKSNLLKLIRFFYRKLEGTRELPPELNSKYSAFGSITIIYTISHRIKQDLKRRGQGNIFDGDKDLTISFIDLTSIGKDTTYELSLKIYSDDSIEWSEKNHKVLNTINYLYPFFDIEARYIDLHNWDKLWHIVSRLKSFNLKDLEKSFVSSDNNNNARKEYDGYIKNIKENIETSKYTYQEKVLAFIKMGLVGDKFLISENDLAKQSDGTNAHKFIELSLKLLISLTRREYITPIIYVDEPEIGLHPKKNEELIENIYDVYSQGKHTTKTPYPTIIFATHSPNIVKQVIKLFDTNQQILHFSKYDNKPTVVQKMNSRYEDKRFLNVFSDNEARLFFSNFILFVEGATELEIFRNKSLLNEFPILKDIDVYATNDVVLKYINPSYANTSIPFLTVYDLDKLFDIDLNNKKIIKLNSVVNFSKLEKKYNNSYYSKENKSKEFDIHKSIEYYIDIINNSKLKIMKNIFLNDIEYKDKIYNYYSLIDFANESIFIHENKFFNHTTIEELLINNESINIFQKWLFHYLVDKEVNTKRLLHTPYKRKKKKKKKVITAIKKIIKKNEIPFIFEINRVTLFLLLFNAKTQTLVKHNTGKYKKINKTFRGHLEDIKKDIEIFTSVQNLFSKTSGWTTSFLDYAINYIEDNKGKNEFRDEFKKYFRELYDIITIIENKI